MDILLSKGCEKMSYKRGFIPYALAALLIGLVGGFSTVLGPAFVQDIGIAYNNTTWTALAQAMSTAACAPILGKVGDVIGRKTTLLLGIAVFTGNFLSCFLPEILTSVVCTGVLAGMGIYRIFNVLFPSEKCREQSRKKKLTWTEAAVMAFALSADSLAIGIGTGLVQTGEWILVAGSFLCGILMMEAGWKIGACFAAAFKKDLSWLSGVCLMVLAAGIWWNG